MFYTRPVSVVFLIKSLSMKTKTIDHRGWHDDPGHELREDAETCWHSPFSVGQSPLEISAGTWTRIF